MEAYGWDNGSTSRLEKSILAGIDDNSLSHLSCYSLFQDNEFQEILAVCLFGFMGVKNP